MQRSVVVEEPWFVRAFERIYLHVYPHRDDTEAEANAPRILDLLGLRAGQHVLDVACGAGRYSRAFARRGLIVMGVDLSEDLLDEARERSPGTPGAPSYVRGDIRRLPFFEQFHGAVSLFTSFGYFEDRSGDLAVVKGVRRALLPGGTFLLDLMNAGAVRAGLEPVSETTTGRFRVRMEREIDDDAPGGPRVRKRVQAFARTSGLLASSYEEDVRLYTPEEVDELLVEGGLELQGDRLGDFDGTPFGPDAPRLVRIARR